MITAFFNPDKLKTKVHQWRNGENLWYIHIMEFCTELSEWPSARPTNVDEFKNNNERRVSEGCIWYIFMFMFKYKIILENVQEHVKYIVKA